MHSTLDSMTMPRVRVCNAVTESNCQQEHLMCLLANHTREGHVNEGTEAGRWALEQARFALRQQNPFNALPVGAAPCAKFCSLQHETGLVQFSPALCLTSHTNKMQAKAS